MNFITNIQYEHPGFCSISFDPECMVDNTAQLTVGPSGLFSYLENTPYDDGYAPRSHSPVSDTDNLPDWGWRPVWESTEHTGGNCWLDTVVFENGRTLQITQEGAWLWISSAIANNPDRDDTLTEITF